MPMTGSKMKFSLKTLKTGMRWHPGRVDPRGTKFKAMSWEEQATYLEQAAQEILRTQEGAVASESGEEIGDPQEDIEAARSSSGIPGTNQGFP
jgi:hypothetical protein